MSITEEQRRALFDRLRAHLDEETATLLLEATMPANVELATRSDIRELRAETLLGFTELGGRLTGQITELGGRLTGQITELDGRLTGQITELDGRLTRQITELDGQLTGQITELDGQLTGQITELDGRLTGQITELGGRLTGLGKELTDTLYRRVVPAIAVLLTFATWIGVAAG
jgi:hypothetical protein